MRNEKLGRGTNQMQEPNLEPEIPEWIIKFEQILEQIKKEEMKGINK
jgi:hypothetical protein